ncbi:MAG: hypothetical protein VXY77_02120 [Pseudomonadota bacterium]|nr:hypothetical protein [Pseudomonadota bacterium]
MQTLSNVSIMPIYNKASITAKRLRKELTGRASRCYEWIFEKSPAFIKGLLSVIEDAFNTAKAPILIAIYQLYIIIGFKLSFSGPFIQAAANALVALFASSEPGISTAFLVTSLFNIIVSFLVIRADQLLKNESKKVSQQQGTLLMKAKLHMFAMMAIARQNVDLLAGINKKTLQNMTKQGSKLYSSGNYFIETLISSSVLVGTTVFASFGFVYSVAIFSGISFINFAAYKANQYFLKTPTDLDAKANNYLTNKHSDFTEEINQAQDKSELLQKYKTCTEKKKDGDGVDGLGIDELMDIKYNTMVKGSHFDFVNNLLEKGFESQAQLIVLKAGVKDMAALSTQVKFITEAIKSGIPLLKQSQSVATTENAYEKQEEFFKHYSKSANEQTSSKTPNHTRKDWLLTTIPRKEHNRTSPLSMSKDTLLSIYYALQLIVGSFFTTQFLAHLSPLHNQSVISNIYGYQSMVSILFNTLALKLSFLPTIGLSGGGIAVAAIVHLATASTLSAGLYFIKQILTKHNLLPNSDLSEDNAFFSIVTSFTLLLITGPLFGLSSVLSLKFAGLFILSTPLWSIMSNLVLTPSTEKIKAAYKTIINNGYKPTVSEAFKDKSDHSVEAVKDILLGKETFVVDAKAKHENDPNSITAHLT